MQLDSANDSKYIALGDVDRLEEEKKALESHLESKSVEAEEKMWKRRNLRHN
jgi:hypothetical protein